MTKIKEIMKSMNIRQMEVCKWCGIHQSRLSLIVNKQSVPTTMEAEKLQVFFQLPIDLLLDEE